MTSTLGVHNITAQILMTNRHIYALHEWSL
jgi:hypothetical protein